MSCIFGENRDIFFQNLVKILHLISFADIAVIYLNDLGYEPYLCKDEDEARELIHTLPKEGNGLVYLLLVILLVKKILKNFLLIKKY